MPDNPPKEKSVRQPLIKMTTIFETNIMMFMNNKHIPIWNELSKRI